MTLSAQLSGVAASLDLFNLPTFMQRALVAAALVGMCAPAVGVYLVQRRMSLLGDGIGHIAFAGVGAGILFGTSPVLTAVLVSAAGAVIAELVRSRAKTSGDIALAILFYGGIATGTLLISINDSGMNQVPAFLFGQIYTVRGDELVMMAVLAAVVLAVTVGLRKVLFSVSSDEDFARVSGVPVDWLNVLLAITAAMTITIAMRIVGLLLISAMMVLPVAATSQVARSFFGTIFGAITLGVVLSTSGVLLSWPLDVGAGALIVVLAIGVFFVTALLGRLRGRT